MENFTRIDIILIVAQSILFYKAVMKGDKKSMVLYICLLVLWAFFTYALTEMKVNLIL